MDFGSCLFFCGQIESISIQVQHRPHNRFLFCGAKKRKNKYQKKIFFSPIFFLTTLVCIRARVQVGTILRRKLCGEMFFFGFTELNKKKSFCQSKYNFGINGHNSNGGGEWMEKISRLLFPA